MQRNRRRKSHAWAPLRCRCREQVSSTLLIYFQPWRPVDSQKSLKIIIPGSAQRGIDPVSELLVSDPEIYCLYIYIQKYTAAESMFIFYSAGLGMVPCINCSFLSFTRSPHPVLLVQENRSFNLNSPMMSPSLYSAGLLTVSLNSSFTSLPQNFIVRTLTMN